MPRAIPSAVRFKLNDRWRLMLLSIGILLVVSLSGVAVTAWQYQLGSVHKAGLAVSETLLLVIAGGTVLVRICNPFIRRLEESEARLRAQMLALEAANESLEAKTDELAKINHELDEFTCIASHDLQEPLFGISSYCRILLEDYSEKLDEEGRHRLEILVGLCERLSRLIRDLLTYSQIGRTQPDGDLADLNEVVRDVLETLGPAVDQRGGAVRVVDPLPTVTADRLWVGEVFRNLVANGLKFNESRRPLVEIGSLAGQPATLYVRDNGIGIPEHHHETIFAMFRRLHSRGKYEGTGAGLTFVRKIVDAHGGRVWLESQPGGGSTFYFTLAPHGPHDVQRQLAEISSA
jgi:light-regulated signal transduction histidine kinase (bacteriophytochrome)